MLEIKQLTKKYISCKREWTILNNINLKFKYGEFVSLVGESGSGKSTLLNIIGLIDEDYDGEVIVDKKSLKTYRQKDKLNYFQNKIGFVFQDFQLLNHLTVMDNLLINSSKKQVLSYLQKFNLLSLADKKVAVLSGGEKQRISIIRALLKEPDIIIADEPTGALDSKNAFEIMKMLKEISALGKLVIVATHSQKLIASSSRVIEISDGKIIKDTNKQQVSSYQVHEKTFKHIKFKTRFKLAYHNFLTKKYRNLMIALASSIGIMSMMLIFAINTSFKEYFLNNMSQVKTDKIEVNKSDNGIFSESEILAISQIKGVSSVAKIYTDILNLNNYLSFNQTDTAIEYLTTKIVLDSDLISGTLPSKEEILLNELMQEATQASVGDIVTLNLNIDGNKQTYQRRVSGIYKLTNSLENSFYQVVIPFADLKIDKITNLSLTVTETEYQNIKQALETLGYQSGLEDEMREVLLDSFDIITLVLLGIAFISILVAMILIGVVMYINVLDRTKEIGIMRSLGFSKYHIFTVMLYETIIIAFISFLTSVVFVNGAVVLFNQFLHTNILTVNISVYFFGLFVSLIIFLLATLIPSKKATKISILTALRLF